MPQPHSPASLTPKRRLATVQHPPQGIDIIQKNFRAADYQLTETVSIAGPQGITYIGGNIRNSAGEQKFSANTWVLVDGQVYSLSSGARSQTFLPDGRSLEQTSLANNDWTKYNDAIYQCELQRIRNNQS